MSETWKDKMIKGWTDPDKMNADMDAAFAAHRELEATTGLARRGKVATARVVEKPRFVDPGYAAAQDDFNRKN